MRRFWGYLSLARNIFVTATFRQSLITFLSTAINGALGAVFYILAARFLGPALFGLMSVAIAVLTLVADVGDLGTDTGLVRFVGRHLAKEKEKAFRFLKLGLKIKIAVWILVFGIGYFLAPYLAVFVFSKPELTLALRLSFFGVGSALLFSFITHTLQGMQKFIAWGAVQIGSNFLRIIIFGAFAYFVGLNLEKTMAIYVVIPLLGFLAGLFLLPGKIFRVKGERKVAKEFFRYNKWVALFTLVAAFSSKLDTFISARLLNASELGLYSAANQLVQIVPQIVTALGTVIAPKMAGMGEIDSLKNYLKKTQILVLGISFLGLFSIPVVSYLIPLLYGKEYLGSIPVFTILILAMLVFLIAVPVHNAVFYYFSYPQLFFWVALGHLLIISLGGWYLISFYGVIGAASVVLIGSIFSFLIPAVWVLKKIKERTR